MAHYSKKPRTICLNQRDTKRFFSHVRKTKKCWLWKAAIGSHGYGVFMLCKNGKQNLVLAHRTSYVLAKGAIPRGKQIDHLCRNRRCVNPQHLEPVTNKENARRGDCGKITGARQRAKTHCPYGHPYSGENLSLRKNGSRGCKTCDRKKSLSFYYRKKGLLKPSPAAPAPAAVAVNS